MVWSSIHNTNNWRLWIKESNFLFTFISQRSNIDKIYLYAKDLLGANYQFLINKTERTGLKCFIYSTAFIEYSDDMDDIYKNIKEYNPFKKRKMVIVFDDMTTDMFSKKKLNPIVTESFIRGRKLNISLVLYYSILFFCTEKY